MLKRTFGYGRWLKRAVGFQREVNRMRLGSCKPSLDSRDSGALLKLFDEIITSPSIRDVGRLLFRDGHYARSVEEAFKCLNNAVKNRSGLLSIDGADLMRTAFSAKDPVLGLNDLSSTSQRDEQRGYMDIFAGSMTGIRNPRAHDHQLNDNPKTALHLLVIANHLMERLQVAEKRDRVIRRLSR